MSIIFVICLSISLLSSIRNTSGSGVIPLLNSKAADIVSSHATVNHAATDADHLKPGPDSILSHHQVLSTDNNDENPESNSPSPGEAEGGNPDDDEYVDENLEASPFSTVDKQEGNLDDQDEDPPAPEDVDESNDK